MEDSESQSSSSDEEIAESVHLSKTITMFPNKKLTRHRLVVAGEIRSEIGNRPCVIKHDPNQIVKETKALLKLGCHSSIVYLVDDGTFRDTYFDISYIVLEKYHDLNLEDYVLDPTTVPVYDVQRGVNFCKQIIDGMKFVHEKLIIHKDLKPSNILLCHDLENIRIADFGSSQEVKSSFSMVPCPFTFGTLGYRPPESLDGSSVSLKSDVFSLGVLLYFLLSKGKSPFGPDSDKWNHNCQFVVVDTSQLLVSNPSATEHLIKSMLNKERCRRPSVEKVERHPCWNGEEQLLNFSYSFEAEFNKSLIDEEVKYEIEADTPEDEFVKALKVADQYLQKQPFHRKLHIVDTVRNDSKARSPDVQDPASSNSRIYHNTGQPRQVSTSRYFPKRHVPRTSSLPVKVSAPCEPLSPDLRNSASQPLPASPRFAEEVVQDENVPPAYNLKNLPEENPSGYVEPFCARPFSQDQIRASTGIRRRERRSRSSRD